MYECMYVCMYVCLYVCVCMYVYTCVFMYVCMYTTGRGPEGPQLTVALREGANLLLLLMQR